MFHSTDLVNWKPIGHVLERPFTTKTTNCKIGEGIYAPLSDIIHTTILSMITTHIEEEDWEYHCENIRSGKKQERSIKLNFDGIDPSIFSMTTVKNI